MEKRLKSFDVLKCLAMYLVIVGHVIQYLYGGYLSNKLWVAIYTFHVPLFFVIAGFFMRPRRMRESEYRVGYIKRKVETMLWPCVWASLVVIVSYCLLGAISGAGRPYLGQMFSILVLDEWFLKSLLIDILLIALLAYCETAVATALVLLTVACVFLLFNRFDLWYCRESLVYVFGGVWIRDKWGYIRNNLRLVLSVSATVAIVMLVFYRIDFSSQVTQVSLSPQGIMCYTYRTILAFAISLALISATAMAELRFAFPAIVCSIGQSTLYIYLLQYIVLERWLCFMRMPIIVSERIDPYIFPPIIGVAFLLLCYGIYKLTAADVRVRGAVWDFGVAMRVPKYIMSSVRQKYRNSEFYLWGELRKERYKSLKASLLKSYSVCAVTNPTEADYYKGVVCLYEGNVVQGGFSDRLRGIISVYMVCKRKGIPFKLYYKHPFDLEWYLVPNEYDWRIAENRLLRGTVNLELLVLDTTSNRVSHAQRQEKWLRKRIGATERQCHVYTNAFFCYNHDFSGAFNELFKPSQRLQDSIDKAKEAVGGEYISVSCRFLDLLGDFNEPFGYGTALSMEESEILISSVLTKIEDMHTQNPQHKILVNSDSKTFLARAGKLDYTHIVPGTITHIDVGGTGGYEEFEKTVLDFFLIAGAVKIFLLRTGGMFRSGFPRSASQVYGRPFEIIEF